jgi:ATP-dependent Lon protease
VREKHQHPGARRRWASNQREYVLRQQLKAIKEELGEEDESTPAIIDVNSKRSIAKAETCREEAEEVARKQLDRLKLDAGRHRPSTPSRAPTSTGSSSIPWEQARPTDHLDIDNGAAACSTRTTTGLDKVKKRIVEYLAVRKLKPDKKGPILCLVGPPGVGKTSLGRSIARAIGRKFVRVSLGGVRDEAEIRGHRRTYVGSLPGRVIQSMKKAGTINPVFMLDEIDKLGHDFRGDPAAALLEVLDPEQNNAFSDHYLEVQYDLSRVMFIATANIMDPVPAALKDRLEILELPGYTRDEKLAIARNFLVPKQLEEHGLSDEQLQITDAAIGEVVDSYTREAGVRNLEREVANVIRGCAVKVAEDQVGATGLAPIAPADLSEFLGPQKYISEVAMRIADPGVATGLAWTPVGGDIIFVEATQMPGKGNLVLTGQLGDVMKESAQAALSYVRSRAADLGLDEKFLEKIDLHVHIPAGSIPKDGPSAGVTLFLALASLLKGVGTPPDVALTGEITLRGMVLPVGGIKEKILAAHRAGIKTVFLPERNEKDLVDVPEQAREELEIRLIKRVDEILDLLGPSSEAQGQGSEDRGRPAAPDHSSSDLPPASPAP